MERAVIKFGDTDTRKQKLHQYKRPILLNNIDVNKIAVSKKVSCGKKGFKYFISSKSSKKIRPLCIFLPKISEYRRDFNETKYICFLIKHEELWYCFQ